MRGATGVFVVMAAVQMFFLGIPGRSEWSLLLQVGLGLLGLFAIFEGAVGWCAMKAFLARNR
jgi:hypothetical protein